MLWSAAKAEPSWAAIFLPSPSAATLRSTRRGGFPDNAIADEKRPPTHCGSSVAKWTWGNGDALGFREVKERSLLGDEAIRYPGVGR